MVDQSIEHDSDVRPNKSQGKWLGLGIEKPKNNGLLGKKNTKGVILKQKGTRMAEDGEDWNGLEMMILKILADFFKYTNDDVVPLRCLRS